MTDLQDRRLPGFQDLGYNGNQLQKSRFSICIDGDLAKLQRLFEAVGVQEGDHPVNAR